jgi:hypothetical protein
MSENPSSAFLKATGYQPEIRRNSEDTSGISVYFESQIKNFSGAA